MVNVVMLGVVLRLGESQYNCFNLGNKFTSNMLTWVMTTAMLWSVNMNTSSNNVLRVLSLQESVPCWAKIVLAIGEPSGCNSRLGLAKRSPRPSRTPPSNGLPRP